MRVTLKQARARIAMLEHEVTERGRLEATYLSQVRAKEMLLRESEARENNAHKRMNLMEQECLRQRQIIDALLRLSEKPK